MRTPAPIALGLLVMAMAISPDHSASARPRGPIMPSYAVTTVAGLNLRRGPRLAARVIETLAYATELQVRGYHTSWAAVIAPDGARGFVLARYIRAVPRAARLADSFPRVANYNGLAAAWQVPFLASDDLVIAPRGAPLGALALADPRALTFLYERTIQVDLCCTRALYGLTPDAIPPQWWLLQRGSRLRAAISATQQWVPVADPRPFAPCQDVLVDGESMHVWAVQGNWLDVTRGYDSAAQPHAAGARIAPHYSYRWDRSNCQPWGPGADPRPWSFNLSSACPRWHGQTWDGFLAHHVAQLVRLQGWRGIFFDNLDDLPPSPLVDANDDGRADGGIIGGVDVWRAGEQALLAETRRLLPGTPIAINGDLASNGLIDEREIEGFPLIPGAAISAGIDSYLGDGANGGRSIVNGDSNAHALPSLPAAQLTAGIALLGDGFVAYDFGWMSHGAPWWFDAYDGGAGSALTAPAGPGATLLAVAHPSRFRTGDVALLDSEAVLVQRVLSRALLVQRGVWGTAAAPHATGTAVTTETQRARGRGYLGRAVGDAFIASTAPRPMAPLPVAIVDSRPRRDGRDPLTGRPLAAGATVTLFSTGHYIPDAASVLLRAPRVAGPGRTIVFEARGPAGQQLWLFSGHTRVPLVLRATWHRYTIPVAPAGDLLLGAGRARGHMAIRGVRIYGAQAFVWRRDYTRGAVLVNATDAMQRVMLDRLYRILPGDQDPLADSGRFTCDITLAPYRAAILLTGPRRTPCPRSVGSQE